MWLRNTWYVAGHADELSQPFVARRLLDTPVIMMRSANGAVSALEDLCPHRLMPLSAGKRVGDDLQCGYHGLRFSVKGVCIEAPGQENIPRAACVRTFPLVHRHQLLWIWLGEPELADPALIPDLHWNDDPKWVPSRGYHYVKADYRLMNDNLLDLSHETYVHQRTIGNEEEESIAEYPLAVTVEGDRLVRAHREMPGIDPPPFFAMILNHKGPIDRWQTAIHLAPGINMTDVGVYPVNTPRSQAFVTHVLHLVTPETERSSHYFWAVIRNYRLDDVALTQVVAKAIGDTFDEDGVVLEIQQRQVDHYGGAVPKVALRLDEAPVRARRLLDALCQREQREPGFVALPLPMLHSE